MTNRYEQNILLIAKKTDFVSHRTIARWAKMEMKAYYLTQYPDSEINLQIEFPSKEDWTDKWIPKPNNWSLSMTIQKYSKSRRKVLESI